MVLMNLFSGRTRDTDVENRLADKVGEEGGGTKLESSMETYTLTHVKQIASGNLLYDAELSLMLCDNLVGWQGMECGREVQEGWRIPIPMEDSC